MDTATPAKQPAPNATGAFRPYPVPVEEEPAPGVSAKFIVFAILLIAGAAIAGCFQSGKLSLTMFSKKPGLAGTASATVATVPPPKDGTFVVTTISVGQPSFAIINGTSHVEGDALEAPGVTGWKVRQIEDGAVVVQNGATLASLPLSTPGIKPLDDELHPLN